MKNVIRIGPRGGRIVRDAGKRPEYEHADLVGGHGLAQPDATAAHVVAARAKCAKVTAATGNEHAIILDEHGVAIFERTGEAGHVDITDDEARALAGKNATLVHSHPNGLSFSDRDFRFFGLAKLRAMEAVTCTNDAGRKTPGVFRSFRVERPTPAATFGGRQMEAHEFYAGNVAHMEHATSFADCVDDALARNLTPYQAAVLCSHETVESVAAALGLRYEVHGTPLGFTR